MGSDLCKVKGVPGEARVACARSCQPEFKTPSGLSRHELWPGLSQRVQQDSWCSKGVLLHCSSLLLVNPCLGQPKALSWAYGFLRRIKNVQGRKEGILAQEIS